MTKVEASTKTRTLAALVTFLQTAASQDRPITHEKIVQDVRDVMLECGFPACNDFRDIGTTKWAGPIRRFITREG